MIKIFFLSISLLISIEGSMGLQTLMRGGSEQLLPKSLQASFSHYKNINNLRDLERGFSTRTFTSSENQIGFDFQDGRKGIQVFSRPTYDRIAKYILAEDESVRVDILRAFTGISTLSSAIQLDEHYNPFDPLHNLRKLINSTSSQNLFDMIRDSSTIELSIDGKKNNQATEILRGLSILYGDLSHAFPDSRYRSTVDFLCDTDFGYVTIEFQVAKQDYWDKRALAYIASIYGNQLRPEKDYNQIKNVIGINLLGDGSAPYWKDGDFMRDYTFMNQRGSKHKIPAMRLIQYSLGDVDFNHEDLKDNDRLRQWIEFFKSAHEKESMPTSIYEPVEKAYEMIRLDTLKKKHPDLLKASEEFFSSLTEHDQAVKEKGFEEGRIEEAKTIALRMLSKGMQESVAAGMTGLSLQQIQELKTLLKE
jgi:predicted transposase/invertase (TIGR01784 family)